MTSQTYYELLGIPRSASAAQIQSAFRRLAMQWHPDRNKRADATERFRKINDAYQCLRDAATRHAYDAAIRRAEMAGGTGDRSRQSHRREQPRHDLRAEFNAHLMLRPEHLVALFTRIDAWLRRKLAH